MKGYCIHPCEDDDCGGYCIGRACETCKYFMPYDIWDMLEETLEKERLKKQMEGRQSEMTPEEWEGIREAENRALDEWQAGHDFQWREE